jgi:hypothetical protein
VCTELFHLRLHRDGVGLCSKPKAGLALAWDEPFEHWFTGKRVARAWLVCPRCESRRRHLYLPELVCRVCLHLDYQSRHQGRRVPGLTHAIILRRRVKADLRPFAPLPHSQSKRKQRIIAQIKKHEGRMLKHLAGINESLARHIKRKGLQ